MDRWPSLMIVCVGRLHSANPDGGPSLTVAAAATHLVDGTFLRHPSGRLNTMLADPGRRAKEQADRRLGAGGQSRYLAKADGHIRQFWAPRSGTAGVDCIWRRPG